ncbi:hypothetical protein [Candidatus Viridilinea mediisalina]|uniref:Uncharacterized protein n=1 Tax=Candidatus Viridilinea mediisalina TaxID=2024553 RepID=A0A2A6RFR8_9CHLR|nr:hypothetical protein [Candidatus Viridilinea mediisalina]PDW01917.1 hypothetical protein CJ255_16620 [Candidatus Viridilinea mediisalina]
MSAYPTPQSTTPNHERPTSTTVPQPSTYVMLPRRLIEDLRDSPAAIGVYSLIGRLFLVTGQPIQLSIGDLEAFDPNLSYGAGRRAIDRLVAAGWLQRHAEVGEKFSYLPTWGRVNGLLIPWDRTAPQLGCPRHVHTIRLNDQLLDVCIGRLRPHPFHRAMVERYMSKPLLNLRDIGAYGMALLGLPIKSSNLHHLRLIDAYNRPKPLPDTYTILAFVSQSSTNQLTLAGWKRLGIPLTHPKPFEGQAMLVIPKELIGTVLDIEIGLQGDKPIVRTEDSDPLLDQGIADPTAGVIDQGIADPIAGVIGSFELDETSFSPLERTKTVVDQPTSGSHGDHGNLPIHRESTTTVSANAISECSAEHGGGGNADSLIATMPTEDQNSEAHAAPADDPTRAPAAELPSAQEPPPSKQPAAANPRKRYGLLAKPAAPAPVYRAPTAPEQPTSPAEAAPASPTAPEQPSSPALPVAPRDSPSAKRLRQLGVRADVAAKLATRSLDQVERVIAQADNQAGIRDRAAWVVSALRALPEREDAPAAPQKVSERAILLHPKISGYERMRWLNRFRNADAAKRPEILREFLDLYPLEQNHASTA